MLVPSTSCGRGNAAVANGIVNTMASKKLTLIGSLPMLPRHKIFHNPTWPGPQAPRGCRRGMRSRVQREAFQLNRRPVLLLSADDDGEQVQWVRDSIAPQQCRAGPYSGDDALRRDGIPRHPLGPWLRSRPSRTFDLPPYLAGQTPQLRYHSHLGLLHASVKMPTGLMRRRYIDLPRASSLS